MSKRALCFHCSVVVHHIKELSVFKSILNFKNLGFVILFEFLPKEETEIIDFDIDELSMYYFIK